MTGLCFGFRVVGVNPGLLFGNEREVVTKGCVQLHNEKLHSHLRFGVSYHRTGGAYSDKKHEKFVCNLCEKKVRRKVLNN